MRAWQSYLAPWLASACLAFAADSCFLNTNWNNIVAGKPTLLAWPSDSTTFWDVILNADVRTQATLVGPVAQNVTQPGVIWVPPLNISEGDPKRLFAIQLWDLGRGTTCNSPSFVFKSNDQPAEQLPPGDVVKTSLAIGNGGILATATIATPFATDVEASYSSSIPTSTSTEAPGKDEPPPNNVAAIVTGVVFGTLVVLLIVLSVMLWRAKRKRTQRRGTLLASDDGTRGDGTGGHDYDGVTTPSTPGPAIELDSKAQPAEMQAVPSRPTPVEMPAPMDPIELPAEVPYSLLPPDRCQSLVSDLTVDSRAASPERFPVSPTQPTQPTRRTSVLKY